MRHLPLHLRLTLWSVLVVALGLLLFAISTGIHAYHEDVELIDTVLKRDAAGVFGQLKHEKKRVNWSDPHLLDEQLPFEWKGRRIEIWQGGALRYRSAHLKNDALGDRDSVAGIRTLRVNARPLRVGVFDKDGWQVRVAMDMREPQASVLELFVGFLIALPVVLATTAFGGWWIARRALAPVAAITAAAEQISATDFKHRLPIPPNKDEIHRLTVVLNRMIDRLEASFCQARRFSSDASHELRTPLAVIRAGIESVLREDGLSSAQQKELLDLLDETTRLASISEKLLLLSRADAGRLELDLAPVDLSALVEEAVDEARLLGEDAMIAVDAHIERGVVLQADADQIMQVLRNLLENAVKYNRPKGLVRVELTQTPTAVRVAVENRGAALKDDQKTRVFERFYRGEMHRSSYGHGLGLNLAREIARAHGGDVILVHSEHDSTVFELQLPRGPHRAAAIGELMASGASA